MKNTELNFVKPGTGSSALDAESKDLIRFSVPQLEKLVSEGKIKKCSEVREHIALHPYWLKNIYKGVSEEVEQKVGKLKAGTDGYVIGYDNLNIGSKTASLNEDHGYLHLDAFVDLYIYVPAFGQILSGKIKKIGDRAAICSIFGLFTATVFPANQSELKTWYRDQQIDFKIYSFQHRRKGPILNGNAVGQIIPPAIKNQIETDAFEDSLKDATEKKDSDGLNLEDSRTGKHKKKKKKSRTKDLCEGMDIS